MTVQTEADAAARTLAAHIRRVDDPLLAIPQPLWDSLSSGEQALVRIARAVESIGADGDRIDGLLQAELGRTLRDLGDRIYDAAPARERAVPCRCGERTWANDGRCATCRGAA